MEPQAPEDDMPMPLNSTYAHGHANMSIHHHDHPIIPSSDDHHHHIPFKKPIITIKYKECLKNHAAAMGGNATDGCGEFLPTGQENTIEALICSACNCHRNFHRKIIEGEHVDHFFPRKMLNYHHHAGTLVSSRHVAQPHQMVMSYNNMASDSDDGNNNGGVVMVNNKYHQPPQSMMKKRFRTKFTPEQKEKLFAFAEKVGWKIQKQEENVVQQFCQEIGVKRRVLKVWMHNNKHNLAKKNNGGENAGENMSNDVQ